MLSSMKVTHSFLTELVFLFSLFIFPILNPSILLSPIVCSAAVYFQASALVQRDGSWERPICRCWDLCYFSLYFSTFLLRPCPEFPHCLSNIHLIVSQSDLSICTYSRILTSEEKMTNSTFSVPFLFLLVYNAFKNLQRFCLFYHTLFLFNSLGCFLLLL